MNADGGACRLFRLALLCIAQLRRALFMDGPMGFCSAALKTRIMQSRYSMCTLTLARFCETLRAFLGFVRPSVTHACHSLCDGTRFRRMLRTLVICASRLLKYCYGICFSVLVVLTVRASRLLTCWCGICLSVQHIGVAFVSRCLLCPLSVRLDS